MNESPSGHESPEIALLKLLLPVVHDLVSAIQEQSEVMKEQNDVLFRMIALAFEEADREQDSEHPPVDLAGNPIKSN